MRLASYRVDDGGERLGLVHGNRVLDLGGDLPATMAEFLDGFAEHRVALDALHRRFAGGELEGWPLSEVTLLAPVPRPSSLRDAYAFRQHVATARQNRGAPMIPEFDQFPVFYFSNHNAVIGPGELAVEKDHLHRLDFELEIAAVIGVGGRNIAAAAADDHIAGFTIMNDFSARQLQMEEMKLNLGPAKGKDFATAIGPWLVTLDELEDVRIPGERGATWDLEMAALHNGDEISRGNVRDMTWSFGEIIERASYGVDLLPGDVIGSGTVGTGCYLELNGTRARQAEAAGESYQPVWLRGGDEILLRIERLGELAHHIETASDYSILEKKRP